MDRTAGGGGAQLTGIAMRNRKWSRRDVLKTSTAFAAGVLFTEPVRGGSGAPSSVTPELVEAARKDSKLSLYSALELSVGERGARHSKPNIRGLPSASSVPAPSGFSSGSPRNRRAALTRSTSPTIKEKRGHPPLSALKLLKSDPAAVLAQSEEIKAPYAKMF
jgi:hypothetical protein